MVRFLRCPKTASKEICFYRQMLGDFSVDLESLLVVSSMYVKSKDFSCQVAGEGNEYTVF